MHADLEAAPRSLFAALAALPHGHLEQLADQALHGPAHLRAAVDSLRQHADAVAADDEPTVHAFDLVRGAEFLEKGRRTLDALGEAAVHSRPICGQFSPDGPHDVVELRRSEALL